MPTEERRLGPYILREVVSSRALTVTYRAEHAELGRYALIKTLKPTVSASSAFAAGLEREAKILARIRHPNVVDIHDFQRDEERIWLVLEPLDGPTLAALRARAARLDEDAAAAIALEIARGLGHAHERGVVHRELRPERVVVTRAGGVKILEFAAAFDGRMPSIPEPFEGSETFARPDYMAPEQILGHEVGPPADVFALGVVLFEMLTGVRPFDVSRDPHAAPEPPDPRGPQPPEGAPRATALLASTPAPADDKAVAHRIRSAPPQPLRALSPDVSRSIERVILRCLEKDPTLRYPDGRAAASALAEALAERGFTEPRPLIAQALAAAKLGGDRPSEGGAAPARALTVGTAGTTGAAPPRSPPLTPDLRNFAWVFALIVAGGALVEVGLRDQDAPPPPSVAVDGAGVSGPGAAQRGYVRVLARPWAEIVIDGEVIDVTPLARPIPVTPGRHYVTFRHPNAPDEKRTISVSAGQTVLVDVTLRIDRPAVDAGAPLPDAAASP